MILLKGTVILGRQQGSETDPSRTIVGYAALELETFSATVGPLVGIGRGPSDRASLRVCVLFRKPIIGFSINVDRVEMYLKY